MGLDPAREPRRVKRRVGYLPDAVGFYGGLTGRQNLRYTARLNGLRRSRGGDGDPGRARPGRPRSIGPTTRSSTYSRGMRQRLGIADALVKSPDLLILDEPTTAIDPLGVVEILELLRRLVDERGLAILLSSHLLTQVQSVCDRIGIFAAGKLVGQGTVEELAATFGDGTATIEVGLELTDARRRRSRRARCSASLARRRVGRAADGREGLLATRRATGRRGGAVSGRRSSSPPSSTGSA